MKVRLVSYSKPVIEDADNITNLVAYCARVSNPGNQSNKETSEKLIRYLINHQHWSPLEMVSMCLEIETTRDIARQILRHRSFSFQEFSQRYADPTKELDFFVREARLQFKSFFASEIPQQEYIIAEIDNIGSYVENGNSIFVFQLNNSQIIRCSQNYLNATHWNQVVLAGIGNVIQYTYTEDDEDILWATEFFVIG